jgi:phosphatidylglycerophosphatase A
MIFHQLFSSCLGIGYIRKGGGTVAAVFCCFVWYFTRAGEMSGVRQILIVGLLLAIGIWSAGEMEPRWGKDSYRIVMDEVVGMGCTLLFIPPKWQYMLIGLVFFRFFDILKPLYIRRTEDWKKGWGVMMDDVAAGIYSNLLLQLIVIVKLW